MYINRLVDHGIGGGGKYRKDSIAPIASGVIFTYDTIYCTGPGDINPANGQYIVMAYDQIINREPFGRFSIWTDSAWTQSYSAYTINFLPRGAAFVSYSGGRSRIVEMDSTVKFYNSDLYNSTHVVRGTVVIDDNTVLQGVSTEIWKRTIPKAVSGSIDREWVSSFGRDVKAMAVSKGDSNIVFAIGEDGFIRKFNHVTNTTIWEGIKGRAEYVGSVDTDLQGNLYIQYIASGAVVIKISGADGSLMWTYTPPTTAGYTKGIIYVDPYGQHVWLQSSDRVLKRMNKDTMAIISTLPNIRADIKMKMVSFGEFPCLKTVQANSDSTGIANLISAYGKIQ